MLNREFANEKGRLKMRKNLHLTFWSRVDCSRRRFRFAVAGKTVISRTSPHVFCLGFPNILGDGVPCAPFGCAGTKSKRGLAVRSTILKVSWSILTGKETYQFNPSQISHLINKIFIKMELSDNYDTLSVVVTLFFNSISIEVKKK